MTDDKKPLFYRTDYNRPNKHGMIAIVFIVIAFVGLWHNFWIVAFGLTNASIWMATEKLAGNDGHYFRKGKEKNDEE